MQTNPYAAELAALQDQLREANTTVAAAQARFTAALAANDLNRLALERNRLEEAIKAKNAIEAQIKTASDAKVKYDEALAQAAAEGLTGEAANIRANALVESAKGTRQLLTYVGIGLLVLLVVFAIAYWRRSRKK